MSLRQQVGAGVSVPQENETPWDTRDNTSNMSASTHQATYVCDATHVCHRSPAPYLVEGKRRHIPTFGCRRRNGGGRRVPQPKHRHAADHSQSHVGEWHTGGGVATGRMRRGSKLEDLCGKTPRETMQQASRGMEHEWHRPLATCREEARPKREDTASPCEF